MSDDVIVVGDGPTGLSAALLLAKNDLEVTVYGDDETAMHSAMLYNYLGIEEDTGTAFMERARDQCAEMGADLEPVLVDDVEEAGEGFRATTEDGDQAEARYLVIATGTDRSLGEPLGLAYDGDAIEADRDGRTGVDGVYAGGWATRPQKIQAAISVGDGAAIALDILSQEAGEPVHDFDVVG
jgi:thioredoxin reductase